MFFKKKSNGVVAFMEGTLVPLEKVNDPVFAQKMMGDGFAIEPTSGAVVSPVDGELTMVFHTKHAVGITTNEGVEVLLHIGINTVELDGEGFEILVEQGSKVKKGDKLMNVDLDLVKKKGKETTSMFILTSGNTISKLNEGEVSLSEENVAEIA